MTPRIAIPLPTAANPEYNSRSWPNYAAAVRDAGGEPVEIPLGLEPGELTKLAASCHGVCLPGSPADVEPSRFGAERDPASAAADSLRETVDFFLLDHAERFGKPVLAICFGCQSLNVWRGGSLIQDLNPLPVNHSAGAKVAIAHTALIPQASFLGSLVDRSEATPYGDFFRLPINSSHHQAIAAPGEGLRIVGRCPDDGVIEAIEADSASRPGHEHRSPRMLLGVQWHPERSTGISATSRNLFARLITEARLLASQPQ